MVSVIMPVYNVEKYLAETLRSVLKTTYPALEVLLMNDGSTDGSLAVANEFARQDSRIRVFSQPNAGASAARNYLVSVARGEYILPIDSDDLVEPTFVGRAAEVLMKHPEVKVVAPRMDQFGMKTGEIHFPPFSLHLLARKNFIAICAMYRKSDWERVGGYCTEIPTREDWEFWLSILEDGGDVVRLPNIEYHYRQYAQSKRHRQHHRMREVVDLVNRRHPELYQREYGGPLRYRRKLSGLLNWFHRLLYPCHTTATDEALKPFLRSLPVQFRMGNGQVIYNRRNQLRLFERKGVKYVVKSFCKPNFLNRIVYGCLRPSKAKRSYDYSLLLSQKGIHVPAPIGYYSERFLGLFFGRSYYVSKLSSLPYTYNDILSGTLSAEAEETYLRAIARTTARLHEEGMIHLDYSRGNILFGQDSDGVARVEIIDLNRIRFHRVGIEEGCHNFAERLPATGRQRRIMAEEYALVRGFDAEECLRLMEEGNREKK